MNSGPHRIPELDSEVSKIESDLRKNECVTQAFFESFLGPMALILQQPANNPALYRMLVDAFQHYVGAEGRKITAAHVAVNHSRLDMLQYLLEKNPGLSLTLYDGTFSPFHIAVRRGDMNILKYLADGASAKRVDFSSNEFASPLHIAVIFEQAAVLEFLLDTLKLKPSTASRVGGLTPLHVAAMGGHAGMIKALVLAGAALSVFDADGKTPLHHAARSGSLESVQTLVQSGAPVLTTTTIGYSALHLAAMGRDERIGFFKRDNGTIDYTGIVLSESRDLVDIVQFLVEQGADVNATDGCVKGTALHMAACRGYLATVKHLVHVGAQLEAPTSDGLTALHLAAGSGHYAVLEWLIEAGAKVEVRSKNDESPLFTAAKAGALDSVRCLVQNGADLNALLQKGQVTALMGAIGSQQLPVVAFLLEAGADPNLAKLRLSPIIFALVAKTKPELDQVKADGILELLTKAGAELEPAHVPGSTRADPLAFAIEHGYLEVVHYLCERGVSVNRVAQEMAAGLNPLQLAAHVGFLPVVQCLVEHGAVVNSGHPPPIAFAAARDHTQVVEYLLRQQYSAAAPGVAPRGADSVAGAERGGSFKSRPDPQRCNKCCAIA